ALGSHHTDLGCRPGEVEIGPELLGTHHDVGATEGLASDDGNFWNRCFSVGIDEFCTAANNAGVFLIYAGQEPWHIDERDDGEIESIAESHKTSGLFRCCDIQGASQLRWLVGDDAYGATFDSAQTDDDIWGIAFLDLQ